MLLNRYLVVSSFPARAVFPEEGENNLSACGECFGWQIDVVEIPSTVVEVAVSTVLPVVKAPVHHGWFHQHKAQLCPAQHGARLVVKQPVQESPGFLSGKKAFHGLVRAQAGPGGRLAGGSLWRSLRGLRSRGA